MGKVMASISRLSTASRRALSKFQRGEANG